MRWAEDRGEEIVEEHDSHQSNGSSKQGVTPHRPASPRRLTIFDLPEPLEDVQANGPYEGEEDVEDEEEDGGVEGQLGIAEQ